MLRLDSIQFYLASGMGYLFLSLAKFLLLMYGNFVLRQFDLNFNAEFCSSNLFDSIFLINFNYLNLSVAIDWSLSVDCTVS